MRRFRNCTRRTWCCSLQLWQDAVQWRCQEFSGITMCCVSATNGLHLELVANATQPQFFRPLGNRSARLTKKSATSAGRSLHFDGRPATSDFTSTPEDANPAEETILGP